MVALDDYKMIPNLEYFFGSLICSILFLIDEYSNDRLGEWGFSFSFSLLRIMVLMLGLIYIFPMLRRMMFFELVYLVWEDTFMYLFFY